MLILLEKNTWERRRLGGSRFLNAGEDGGAPRRLNLERIGSIYFIKEAILNVSNR
jgi:hypothetical protein